MSRCWRSENCGVVGVTPILAETGNGFWRMAQPLINRAKTYSKHKASFFMARRPTGNIFPFIREDAFRFWPDPDIEAIRDAVSGN